MRRCVGFAATTVQARALDYHRGLLLLILTALFGLLGTACGPAMEIAARTTRGCVGCPTHLPCRAESDDGQCALGTSAG
ncbi:hypothetical protein [Streptomyces sp. NPDC007883]|uniref:hypothetical protein n=1 Tax=Streptomyces sp. NPDC007883 TaxID=3155116 RepID=UPI0033F2092D